MNPYNCILKKKKEKFFPPRRRKYSTPYCDIVSEINGKTVIANENFKENKNASWKKGKDIHEIVSKQTISELR